MKTHLDFTDYLLELADKSLAVSAEIRKTVQRHQVEMRLGARQSLEGDQNPGDIGQVGAGNEGDSLQAKAV